MAFSIESSKLIVDRRDFGAFCNLHGYIEAAEVGVDRGDFAWNFLRQWRGFTLALIDTWGKYDEMQWDRMPDMMQAVHHLADFGDRARFMRCDSSVAASIWRGKRWRLDFCYIDASHDYDNVKMDIESWWELVHPDGCLAGHDFDGEHPGVKQAVIEFAESQDLTVYVTRDATTSPSWYLMKGKS